MNAIREMFSNEIIITGILAFVIAQLLKVLFDYYTTKEFNIWRFIGGSGGMPSSHSALVVALCVSVFKICGPGSAEFAISFFLAIIVMYDASGVRRAAGEQAKVLNTIIEKWQDPDFFEKQLKELLGHTPFEVLAGAILGLIIGIIF